MNESLQRHDDPVTGLLTADHRRLDAVLADVKQEVKDQDLARARSLFAGFRRGLERHILVEEEVLFPAFEHHTGAREGGPTAVMRAEHAEIRRLMADVAGALEAAEGPPATTTPLAELTAILYAHNGKEERILYPMSDRALAEDEPARHEIARRMREG